jgi:hypothetical protein
MLRGPAEQAVVDGIGPGVDTGLELGIKLGHPGKAREREPAVLIGFLWLAHTLNVALQRLQDKWLQSCA